MLLHLALYRPNLADVIHFFKDSLVLSLDTSELLRYCEKGRRIHFEDALGNENICPWRARETTSVAFLARTEKNVRF